MPCPTRRPSCFDGYQCYPRYRAHTFSESRVHCILRIGQRLYLGADDGLLVYDIRRNAYERVAKSPKDIRALLSVGRRMYIGASSGLFVYDHHGVSRVKGIASAAEMMNNVVGMLLVIGANTIARKASDVSLY